MNDRSAQFMISYGACNLLTMADMELHGQQQLYEALPPESFKADILRGRVSYSSDKHLAANVTEITAQRAIEIITLNKNGEKPNSLIEGERMKPELPVDLATQEDLNRFDSKFHSKHKKKKKNENKQIKSSNADWSEVAVVFMMLKKDLRVHKGAERAAGAGVGAYGADHNDLFIFPGIILRVRVFAGKHEFQLPGAAAGAVRDHALKKVPVRIRVLNGSEGAAQHYGFTHILIGIYLHAAHLRIGGGIRKGGKVDIRRNALRHGRPGAASRASGGEQDHEANKQRYDDTFHVDLPIYYSDLRPNSLILGTSIVKPMGASSRRV